MTSIKALVFIFPLVILWGCGNQPTTPVATSSTYLGVLYDSVLASVFASAHMNYSGTQYRYSLHSDMTFRVDENVGMGWTSPGGEEGTYSVNVQTYTFVPTIDRRDSQNPPGTMTPTDSLRPTYTGTIVGDSITITNFFNIENKASQRNLGTLILKKQ
jgi:hypothetical protein